MAYRNIFITSPSKLSTNLERLVINTEEQFFVPLEDINSILIESTQVNISSFLLQKIAEYKICLFVCDEKHMPNGIFLPFGGHSRKLKVLNSQIKMTMPQLKNLWKEFVVQKILNQAKVLSILDLEGVKELESLSRKVLSGDTTNMEAIAAHKYFRCLFGNYFVRRNDDIVNGCLNYGYSIIRGLVARTLVVHGFEPSLGLFHHSELNAFNLVDDVMEIYRPVVDLFVYINVFNLESPEGEGEEKEEREIVLDRDLKFKLFNIINMNVLSNGEKHSVSYAIERTVASLTTIYTEKSGDLKLCEIIELEQHRYE